MSKIKALDKNRVDKEHNQRTEESVRESEAALQSIFQRKQAEDALRDSEERFRTALEANPDPFVLYDSDGKVIFLTRPSPGFSGGRLKSNWAKRWISLFLKRTGLKPEL